MLRSLVGAPRALWALQALRVGFSESLASLPPPKPLNDRQLGPRPSCAVNVTSWVAGALTPPARPTDFRWLGRSCEDIVNEFARLDTRAGLQAHAVAAAIVALPQAHDDKQAYPNNVGTDPRWLNLYGEVGVGSGFATSCNAVLTHPRTAPPPGCAAVIQAEGPRTPADARELVALAVAAAEQRDASQVIFVNMAGAPGPNYLRHVGAIDTMYRHSVAASRRGGFGPRLELKLLAPSGARLAATYLQTAVWSDEPRAAASRLVVLAEELADLVAAQATPPLVMITCDDGMDRSALVNALFRLILQARLQGFTPGQEAKAVRRVTQDIRDGRPTALATLPRYGLVYDAFDLYLRTRR